MKTHNEPKSLQVGEFTNDTTPVAAIIEINGMMGLEKFFFQGDKAGNIIDSLQQYQDLYCLCSMASEMGTEEDADIATRLDDFLCSSYGIEDFDNFDFPFSIGSIRCTAWAKGKNNCELLKTIHEKNKK